eukprot:TRINITY_DN121994_c0_g1_i1.p1 TRINITY_DN121994_c0_g1~~TRINITY_DN121994_c0_g1_i1.p1  ORF type:complete len:295 (-),score=55.60 TRINITY_DN121994_c0_g1_i1:146-1030(-)
MPFGRVRKSRARAAVVACCAVLTATHLLSLGPSSREAEQPSGASFAAGAISTHGHRDMRLASADTTWGILPKPVAPLKTSGTEVNSGMEGAWSNPMMPQFREFVQHIMRRLGRLEERWLGPINFDRANLRISGMDTYSVVASVLILTLTSLYGATSLPAKEEEATPAQKRLYEIQMVCLMVAMLCSTYCMITFLLNKVYSCTALGLWKDVAYNSFMRDMVQVRLRGFWSMMIALVALMTSFSLNLIDKVGGKRGWAVGGASILMGIWMCVQWADVYNAASHYIYNSYPNVKVLA